MSERNRSRLIGLMRNQGAYYNPPTITIGKIIESNPLTIKIGDQQIYKNNIKISDFLLSNYTRKISLTTTAMTGTTSNGDNINSINISNGNLNTIEGLNKGDEVACLLTDDKQTYFILCKVVSIP
jgi:hypothetical protein